jgi:hypothetical protein
VEQDPVDPVEQPVMFSELTKKQRSPLAVFAGVFSAALGYSLLRMFDFDMRVALYIGTGVGIAFGLLPFAIAQVRGIQKLGMIAVFVCAVAGAIGGALLAAPIAIAFTIVALRNN